jgi:hypothetical protein
VLSCDKQNQANSPQSNEWEELESSDAFRDQRDPTPPVFAKQRSAVDHSWGSRRVNDLQFGVVGYATHNNEMPNAILGPGTILKEGDPRSLKAI